MIDTNECAPPFGYTQGMLRALTTNAGSTFMTNALGSYHPQKMHNPSRLNRPDQLFEAQDMLILDFDRLLELCHSGSLLTQLLIFDFDRLLKLYYS